MTESLTQVFLLTGAASGIGRHLAGALSAAGHRVLAADVNAEGLGRARVEDGWAEEAVLCHPFDVRVPADWEAALGPALARFGRVNVLLNVAAYLKPGAGWEADAAEVDKHVDTNLKGVVHGTRALGRYFVAQRQGHIVNFGSLASLAPVPGLTLYSATKFAVRAFSLASAQELKPHGVAVTVVLPDAVQTPMLELQVDYPEAALTFSGSRPLTVQDIHRVLLEKVLPHRPLEATLPFHRGPWRASSPSGPAWRPPLPRRSTERAARRKPSRTRSAPGSQGPAEGAFVGHANHCEPHSSAWANGTNEGSSVAVGATSVRKVSVLSLLFS